ncbi:MAG TPA: TIGR01212 family radical SAM protein [Spirochaetota bacterium]|nr:MAG: coproporphyrinogen III oxidase [Spirochaetes bacterium ADurb.Bin133]HPY87120.1 TIGR01212 family radical SAM protein [Spirochaetota bacterium]
MSRMKFWGNKRYYALDFFLKQNFGKKVGKINIDGGFSCPNRDGTISYDGCSFCSPRGSGDFCSKNVSSITRQIKDTIPIIKSKWNINEYIAYFQAFSGTYAPIDILKAKYDEALSYKGVVGLAIATRPDCLSSEILDVLSYYNEKTFLWIELGLQTANDDIGRKINRGYDLKTFDNALNNLKIRNIKTVPHIIFGLPGEFEDSMMKSIAYISDKKPFGIKIHQLLILKGTKMERLYLDGKFAYVSKDYYSDLVVKAIGALDESIVIHRIMADASEESLIEPKWSREKISVLNGIDKRLKELKIYQGINTK